MNLAKRNLLALAENSKQVLLLKANWDDEGGKAVSAISFCRAMELAFHIINTTKQNLCPEVNVCPDGNIDLAFREKQFFLLVKVSPDSISWYGDDGEEKNQIQGKQRKIHSRKMIDWILSSVIYIGMRVWVIYHSHYKNIHVVIREVKNSLFIE